MGVGRRTCSGSLWYKSQVYFSLLWPDKSHNARGNAYKLDSESNNWLSLLYLPVITTFICEKKNNFWWFTTGHWQHIHKIKHSHVSAGRKEFSRAIFLVNFRKRTKIISYTMKCHHLLCNIYSEIAFYPKNHGKMNFYSKYKQCIFNSKNYWSWIFIVKIIGWCIYDSKNHWQCFFIVKIINTAFVL